MNVVNVNFESNDNRLGGPIDGSDGERISGDGTLHRYWTLLYSAHGHFIQDLSLPHTSLDVLSGKFLSSIMKTIPFSQLWNPIMVLMFNAFSQMDVIRVIVAGKTVKYRGWEFNHYLWQNFPKMKIDNCWHFNYCLPVFNLQSFIINISKLDLILFSSMLIEYIDFFV